MFILVRYISCTTMCLQHDDEAADTHVVRLILAVLPELLDRCLHIVQNVAILLRMSLVLMQ